MEHHHRHISNNGGVAVAIFDETAVGTFSVDSSPILKSSSFKQSSSAAVVCDPWSPPRHEDDVDYVCDKAVVACIPGLKRALQCMLAIADSYRYGIPCFESSSSSFVGDDGAQTRWAAFDRRDSSHVSAKFNALGLDIYAVGVCIEVISSTPSSSQAESVVPPRCVHHHIATSAAAEVVYYRRRIVARFGPKAGVFGLPAPRVSFVFRARSYGSLEPDTRPPSMIIANDADDETRRVVFAPWVHAPFE